MSSGTAFVLKINGGLKSSGCVPVRSIHQESHSTESLNRTITFSASGQATSSGSNVRSASASGQGESFYHSEWEDHWWSGPETWASQVETFRDPGSAGGNSASGGTYQNATYDDYNYQYQWTKTWVPEGEPDVSESATNHVTGIENGTATGWSFWSITWGSGSGSGSGSGTSSSSSWSTSRNPSYDTTVTYPGFYSGAYYASGSGGYSGGGGSPEEYFAYVGDAFTDGSSSGFTGTMFPFAYSDEGQQSAQGQTAGGFLALGEGAGQPQSETLGLAASSVVAPGVPGKHGLLRDPKGVGTISPGLQMQPGEGPGASPDVSSVGQVRDNPNGRDVMPTAEGVSKEAWDDPNWRLGPWGSFFGTVYAGIAGVGRVLTYPGRLIPGTREFWERRDRALQRLYDASNIGGTGWQTMSEVGSQAAAVALTWGIARPFAGATGTAGAGAEQAVIRLAARLRFTQTTAAHMANPARHVPRHILADAILHGTRMPDPQGAAGAVKIVSTVFRNGQRYVLEIIYRESDNTILHFVYHP